MGCMEEMKMKFSIDEKYLIDCFKTLVNVPSPVCYPVKINPLLEKMADEFGCKMTYEQYHDFYRDNYNQWAADHISKAEKKAE